MTEKHHAPKDVSDKIALGFTKALRFVADAFFAKRYGHRDRNHEMADELSGNTENT